MSVNFNGACGDLDWMTGDDNDPITLGYHAPSDPFAPFSVGAVVVPTTGDVVITGVAGTEAVVEKANMLGLNDAIADANMVPLAPQFGQLATVVNATNNQYKQIDIDLTLLGQGSSVDLSHDNMFPLSVNDRRSSSGAIGSTYNWIDSTRVRAEITAFNSAFMQNVDASAVIRNEVRTNPNAYDGAAARVVIDTIMAHFLPRAYMGLNLDALVSTQDLLTPEQVAFAVTPNPASEYVLVETAVDQPIRDWAIYDMNGRRVRQGFGVNNYQAYVTRGDLPRGAYVLRIRVDKGISAKKIIFE